MLRAAVFADVSNLYFCVREKMGGKIDYAALRSRAARNLFPVRTIAYGIETTDVSAFKKALRESGWELRFKTPKSFSDGTKKADQDVNIAMDIVRIIDMVDIIVLCSADGDFAPVLRYAKEKGRLTIVHGCGISHELKEVADEHYEITEDLLNASSKTTDGLVLSSYGVCSVTRRTSQ